MTCVEVGDPEVRHPFTGEPAQVEWGLKIRNEYRNVAPIWILAKLTMRTEEQLDEAQTISAGMVSFANSRGRPGASSFVLHKCLWSRIIHPSRQAMPQAS